MLFVELALKFLLLLLFEFELSGLVMFLLLLLFESLVELFCELSWLAVEYSLADAPVAADWSDVAVAVCVPPEPSAAPLLVGFAQAVPAIPKAKLIADAQKAGV